MMPAMLVLLPLFAGGPAAMEPAAAGAAVVYSSAVVDVAPVGAAPGGATEPIPNGGADTGPDVTVPEMPSTGPSAVPVPEAVSNLSSPPEERLAHEPAHRPSSISIRDWYGVSDEDWSLYLEEREGDSTTPPFLLWLLEQNTESDDAMWAEYGLGVAAVQGAAAAGLAFTWLDDRSGIPTIVGSGTSGGLALAAGLGLVILAGVDARDLGRVACLRLDRLERDLSMLQRPARDRSGAVAGWLGALLPGAGLIYDGYYGWGTTVMILDLGLVNSGFAMLGAWDCNNAECYYDAERDDPYLYAGIGLLSAWAVVRIVSTIMAVVYVPTSEPIASEPPSADATPTAMVLPFATASSGGLALTLAW